MLSPDQTNQPQFVRGRGAKSFALGHTQYVPATFLYIAIFRGSLGHGQGKGKPCAHATTADIIDCVRMAMSLRKIDPCLLR